MQNSREWCFQSYYYEENTMATPATASLKALIVDDHELSAKTLMWEMEVAGCR